MQSPKAFTLSAHGAKMPAIGYGTMAVPRALEEAHIAENLDVFDFSLSEDEMRRISTLRNRNIRIADPPERAPKWDLETVA